MRAAGGSHERQPHPIGGCRGSEPDGDSGSYSGNQMTETVLRPARHALAAGDGANAADSSESRLAMRLWTLLHAQALLQGTIGGAGGVLNAEDDRWRLAARRETTHQR